MSSNIKMASAEQQRKIFEWLKFGLDWASGRAGSEELIRTFGRPKLDNVLRKVRSLDYFPDFASISLESNIDDGSAKAFTLTVSSELDTNIPKESYENLLGLHRVVRGELIDGQRTEESDFFNPNIVPKGNPDVVTLIYRVPLPSESAFDVYVDIDYLVGLAEWREARRRLRIGANRGLRNSQFQYGIGLSSGSEKRR